MGGFFAKSYAVFEAEMAKLRRDNLDLFTRAIQPTLWLLVFGQVFNRTKAIPTENVPYIDFMTPGILAQGVLFMSIFYGLSAIWERDLGILQKFLVSPAPRSSLIFGKAMSAGVRALAQAAILGLIATVIGVHLNLTPLNLIGIAIGIVLGAAVFCTFSLIIACWVKSRERFMGIGQVLTMPLFFASNAIYPISMMPGWLQIVSKVNPLSYEVDLLRTLMLEGVKSSLGLGVDYAVLSVTTVVLIAIASRLYPSLGY